MNVPLGLISRFPLTPALSPVNSGEGVFFASLRLSN